MISDRDIAPLIMILVIAGLMLAALRVAGRQYARVALPLAALYVVVMVLAAIVWRLATG